MVTIPKAADTSEIPDGNQNEMTKSQKTTTL